MNKPTLLSLTLSISLLVCALGATSAGAANTKPTATRAGGVIHACLKTKGRKAVRGTIRVVGSPKACRRAKGERPLNWNLSGPTGANGGNGSPGTAGPAGPAGANGSPGATGAQGSSGQIETQLKEVITKQNTLINGLTNEVNTLTKDLLGVELSVDSATKGLGTVETTVTNLTGGLTGVENGLSGLKATVGSACGQLGTVTTQVNGVGATLTTLGNTVNTALAGILALPDGPDRTAEIHLPLTRAGKST